MSLGGRLFQLWQRRLQSVLRVLALLAWDLDISMLAEDVTNREKALLEFQRNTLTKTPTVQSGRIVVRLSERDLRE